MTYLTKNENDLIQRYLKSATADLNEMELDLEIGEDLQDCKAAYNDIPGNIIYPKTHDPDHCYLTPSNAFWCSFIERRTGDPIVVGAHRIIETRSLVGEIYTHRAFGDRLPVVDTYDIGLQEGLPQLSGRMGSTGGIVTHEMWQKRGLGSLIARVMQALSIRHFEIDYQYSFTVDNPNRRRLVRNGYGIEHSVLATVGTTPINGKSIGVMLNYSSRQELLARMKKELGVCKLRRLQAPARIRDNRHPAIQVA